MRFTGYSCAEITIQMRNEGIDAYQADVFGSRIGIVRHINLSERAGKGKGKAGKKGKASASVVAGGGGRAGQLEKFASSAYQLRAASGRIVSRKSCDLQRLLAHFGIDPENPIAILQQETARVFLASTSPQKRYNVCVFFRLSLPFFPFFLL